MVADLPGSLWTCILSSQRHFSGTSPSATSHLAFCQVLAPELSSHSGLPQAQSDQCSRPSAISPKLSIFSYLPKGVGSLNRLRIHLFQMYSYPDILDTAHCQMPVHRACGLELSCRFRWQTFFGPHLRAPLFEDSNSDGESIALGQLRSIPSGDIFSTGSIISESLVYPTNYTWFTVIKSGVWRVTRVDDQEPLGSYRGV